jgi:hypothetical protein
MFEIYYTGDYLGQVSSKMNIYSKEDLFNIQNMLCYATEGEAQADIARIVKVLENYRLIAEQMSRHPRDES